MLCIVVVVGPIVCILYLIFFIQVVKTVYASPSRVDFQLDSRKVCVLFSIKFFD